MNVNGDTVLHEAAQRGFSEGAKVLLEEGDVGVNIMNRCGATPLHYAAEAKTQPFPFTITMDKHNYVDDNNESETEEENLNDEGKNKEVNSNSRDIAPMVSYEKTIKVLIDAGANIEALRDDGTTPLHIAASNGHLTLAQMLLDAGANINAERSNGSHKSDGWTALHLAADKGYARLVSSLIHKKADVHDRTKDGWTALSLAACGGHASMVDDLLAAGATPNERDETGMTPLHLAASNGHDDVVQILLDVSADCEAQDNQGWTPLHCAAYSGYVGSMKIFSERVRFVFTPSSHINSTQIAASSQTNAKNSECLELLLQLVGKFPTDHIYHLALASCYSRLSMSNAAIESFDSAVDLIISEDNLTSIDQITHGLDCLECDEEIRGYWQKCMTCAVKNKNYNLCDSCVQG